MGYASTAASPLIATTGELEGAPRIPGCYCVDQMVSTEALDEDYILSNPHGRSINLK